MIGRIKTIFSDKIRTIAITSPAGFPDEKKLAEEIINLRAAGFVVKEYLPYRAENTPQYLSAAASERTQAFNQAANDPEVDLILCSRGGFGCVHLLQDIDYSALQKRALPVMGYSDITALHCAMLSRHAGIAIAGSNLLNLSKIVQDDFSYQSHAAALNDLTDEKLDLPQELQMLNGKNPNTAISAYAYAANLTVLSSLCGSGFMPDFKDMILILEDIDEKVYKLDRMLHQLYFNGVFDHLTALVFADFSGAAENPAELDELFTRFAAKLDVPCLKGFPFGHTLPMCAINSSRKLVLQLPNKCYFSAD